MKSGIYKIVNKLNNKYYLGSSKDFHVRKLKHFNELRKGKHHNIYLQRAFNKYGEENFEFVIVEECENTFEREQELLNELNLKLCYNVSLSATGGYLIKNHPNREEIIKKNTLFLLNAPKRKKTLIGENNPNWKGGISKYIPKPKRDKTGVNNPFYGKKHSKEAKNLISKARTGVYNGNQEKIVIIDNIEYRSLSQAAKIFNVVPATILNRIKSKNYPTYNYK